MAGEPSARVSRSNGGREIRLAGALRRALLERRLHPLRPQHVDGPDHCPDEVARELAESAFQRGVRIEPREDGPEHYAPAVDQRKPRGEDERTRTRRTLGEEQ